MDVTVADTVGKLDRVISELLILSEQDLDDADCQTMKHHVEDIKAAARLVESRIHTIRYNRQELRRNQLMNK